MESWRDRIDKPGGRKDSRKRQQRCQQKKDGKDRLREPRGFLVPLFCAQASIDRNERRGENALTEKILQEIRNTEGGTKRIRSI